MQSTRSPATRSASSTKRERPYRSHLQPACLACRRRKSRCKIDHESASCLMCRVHSTECFFPRSSDANIAKPIRHARASDEKVNPIIPTTSPVASFNDWQPPLDEQHVQEPVPDTSLSLDGAEQDNSHIIGPAVTSDTKVLLDYFSTIPNSGRALRMITPMPNSPQPAGVERPVMFTLVQKRPVGLAGNSHPPPMQLQFIEKLVEPWADMLIDVYFEKSNICFPLLDKASFKEQYQIDRNKISPALLACLYAHALIYWRSFPELSAHRCPDLRYIWNLANTALYSELHLSPGISTIIAMLLNIGGRPTTSLIGNGVQLGSAVSLAHSLGLNRNPLNWHIPKPEKYLRIKVWWNLMIHDRWCSLAYGTPPHISRTQYDVPLPTSSDLCAENCSTSEKAAASVFVALASLAEVLGNYLRLVYDVNKPSDNKSHELELDHWVEGLDSDIRRIIIRGNDLNISGAANLRLAYLSTRLLLRRMELDSEKDNPNIDVDTLANRHIRARRTAEDIVLFVQELNETQLSDFWLPVSAFAFTSTITFLLRCALEVENSSNSLDKSISLNMANDLITALQSYRQNFGWDIGDICLAQYAEIVEGLLSTSDPIASFPGIMPNMPVVDEMFPSLWDMFQQC